MPMIEVDPARPVLWRDARSLQIGARPAVVVLEDPSRWQLKLLAALEGGIPAGRIAGVAAAFGAEPAETAAFLAVLGPALREVAAPREISLVTADRVPHEAVLGMFDGLRDAGFVAVRRTAIEAASGGAAILLGRDLVPPHLAREMMSADVPHLPISLEVGRAVVGPYILPGTTACLSCLWEHERERDAAWPMIATQLASRTTGADPSRTLGALAASLVARVVSSVDERSSRTRSVAVSLDGRRRWRSHRPHAACLCRSPRESEMPVALLDRPETTTPRGAARRG